MQRVPLTVTLFTLNVSTQMPQFKKIIVSGEKDMRETETSVAVFYYTLKQIH